MCKKDILGKIKKALELAERAGTEAEAQTAYAKAQELMIKYSVTESELPSDEAEIVTIAYEEDSKRINKFVKRFGVTLMNHFPIEIMISHGGGYNHLMIIGRKVDAETFKIILASTIHSFNIFYYRHHRRLEKENSNRSRTEVAAFRNSYCKGFVEGLDASYKMNEQEKGLIVVSPDAVTVALKTQATGKKTTINMGSYGKGYAEGVNDGKNTGKENKRSKMGITA